MSGRCLISILTFMSMILHYSSHTWAYSKDCVLRNSTCAADPKTYTLHNTRVLWIINMEEDAQRWSEIQTHTYIQTHKTISTQHAHTYTDTPCVCSVVSDSATLQTVATVALCPWDFPGKNIRVGCYFLLQGIFLTRESNLHLLHCKWILLSLSQQGSPHGRTNWNEFSFKASLTRCLWKEEGM